MAQQLLLIGSRAAYYRGITYRKPLDYDYISSDLSARYYILQKGLIMSPTVSHDSKIVATDKHGAYHEFDTDLSGSNALLLDLVPEDELPSLDLLFTIKTAHRFKKDSPHFWKTLADWHCMRAMGAKVRPEYKEFLALREKETYTHQHPKLNTSKTQFFDGAHGIQYKYDHDSIHQAIALQDQPAYRYFLKGEVWTSRQLFDTLPRRIQLNSVIEEAMVLAIERSLVPFPGSMTPLQAWRFALSKIMSSISSGWWREFAYENALEILKLYPGDVYWTNAQQKGFVP